MVENCFSDVVLGTASWEEDGQLLIPSIFREVGGEEKHLQDLENHKVGERAH